MSAAPSPPIVEALRLGVVLLVTAGGFALGPSVGRLVDADDVEMARLITSVLGALVGYLLGGVLGRALVRSVENATERLRAVPSLQLVSAAAGAAVGGLSGLAVMLPLFLLPMQQVLIPIALLIVLALAYAGGRLGSSRSADLARFLGQRGRLEVSTPSRGSGVKLVDSSALIDGRIVGVARAGFLEGTLVVPLFVLEEVQALADSADPQRRRVGQRGLEALQVVQDEGLVGVEISTESVPGVTEVDAKLAAMARERRAALLTCDGNLAQLAEIGGVRVLNFHALADSVRPPVLPGSRLGVRLVKQGREPDQAVGYLEDGTMVVVEAAAAQVGSEAMVEVTSIMQTRKGRMLFAALVGAP